MADTQDAVPEFDSRRGQLADEGYVFNGDVYCALCVPDADADESPQRMSDSENVDSPSHCCNCSALLPCELTTYGADYVRGKLADNDGDPVILDLWRATFADTLDLPDTLDEYRDDTGALVDVGLGCYRQYYVCRNGDVLCATCAQKAIDGSMRHGSSETDPEAAESTADTDESVVCDNCGEVLSEGCTTDVDPDKVRCVVDGGFGIYAPQTFCERFDAELTASADRGEIDPDDVLTCLDGPYTELGDYWDAWLAVADDAVLIAPDGARWTVYHSGDIFLVADGYRLPEQF